MSRQRRSSPDRTAGDSGLWHQLTHQIKPLVGRKAKSLPEAPDPREISIPVHPPEIARPKHQHKEINLHSTADVDGALLSRLRAGELPVAGRIDLHGMVQLEAEAALTRFIHHGYHNGRRCVLVITGRSGILREMTPRWLNEPSCRPYILALAPAKKHGGDGAMYVLLKRRREE